MKDRVTAALVAIVSLFVGVQGLLAFLSLVEQEDDLADEWVLAEARRLALQAERGELRGGRAAELFTPTPTLSAWLVEPSGSAVPGPLPSHLQGLSEGPHRPRAFDAELHIVVLPTSQGRLYVQYDASVTEAKVNRFGVYLLGLGFACVALALVVARWVAAIVVAPIDRLAQRLSRWVPDAAVADVADSDEENRLADAFRRVQSRFEEAIAREREFAVNIRHEIRTPLAALRTDLEMLALAEQPDTPRSARVQRALSMADAVNATLEAARGMSRPPGAEAQPIDLARCVDDAWSSLGAYPGIEGLRFVNAVAPATIVRADRHALLTILRNLIRNAIEHAAPAQCTVRCSDAGIEVIDDGPGIDPADLPFVFERYYRGRLADAPGIEAADRGIGLAIARQIADLNGWTLEVDSEPGRGARFVLRLA